MKMKAEQIITIQHRIMAFTGGFFGGYAILTRADVFGNAQTANLIGLTLAITGRNAKEVLCRIFCLLLYIFGTALYTLMVHRTNWNVKRIAVGIDAICAVLLIYMPRELPIIVTLYPIAFAMSFQWNAFPGNYGYISSTIFSTNNTKQATISMVEYILSKDRAKLHRSLFFMGSLLWFHLGVAYAWLGVRYMEWYATLLLFPALVLGWVASKKSDKD